MRAISPRLWSGLLAAVALQAGAAGAPLRADFAPPPRCGIPPEDGSEDKSCRRTPADKRAGWRLIAVSPSVRVYASPETLRSDRSLKAAWLVWAHDQEQKLDGGAAYQSYKELAVFDCKARAHASRQQIYYQDGSASGEVVHQSQARGELEYLEYAPGSVGEAVIKATCALQRK